MEEVKVDSKHRVVLPEAIRRESGIKPGSRLRVSVDARSVVLTKEAEPEEFIQSMEGVVKEGSRVHRLDPIKLKEILSVS